MPSHPRADLDEHDAAAMGPPEAAVGPWNAGPQGATLASGTQTRRPGAVGGSRLHVTRRIRHARRPCARLCESLSGTRAIPLPDAAARSL